MTGTINNKRNSGFNNNAILQLTKNTDYNPEQSFLPTGALQVAGGASIQISLYVGEQLCCDTFTTSGNVQVNTLRASGSIYADGDVNSATINILGNAQVGRLTSGGNVQGQAITATTNITAITGNITATTGNITASNGNVIVPNGNFTAVIIDSTSYVKGVTASFTGTINTQSLKIMVDVGYSQDSNGALIGSLFTAEEVGITKNAYVGGDLTMKGVLQAPASTDAVKIKSLKCQGDLSVKGVLKAPVATDAVKIKSLAVQDTDNLLIGLTGNSAPLLTSG